VVVVVDGGVVVVVVVTGALPPPVPPLVPPPPEPPLVPPPPEPPLVPPPPVPPLVPPVPAPPPSPETIGVVVIVGSVIGEEIVSQRFTKPENWLLLDSEARVRTTSVRTALESLPPKADAEASIFTMATRTLDEIARVRILGMRCVVFARKKFLSEPLYMGNNFAVSNHVGAYEISTVPQIN
jgi:hypothetical protein